MRGHFGRVGDERRYGGEGEEGETEREKERQRKTDRQTDKEWGGPILRWSVCSKLRID